MKSFIVDAFTNEMFKGNPAAVCLVPQALPKAQMQAIAQEFNLSETAFVQTTAQDGVYHICYFSPKMEIPLCGHATLASAKIIFDQTEHSVIHFITTENLKLTVKASGKQLVMEFPTYETRPMAAPPALLSALGIERINNSVYNQETNILLLEIESTTDLAELQPDFNALAQSHDKINGVLVTAKADSEAYDFHSRYFWPWSGGDEDPVTGATHTFLCPYWAARIPKQHFKSFQASARTGFMELELIGNQKLLLKGEAVIVLRGNLSLPQQEI